MSIQAGVNQLLSNIQVFSVFNPESRLKLEEKAEAAKLKRQEKSIAKQVSLAEEAEATKTEEAANLRTKLGEIDQSTPTGRLKAAVAGGQLSEAETASDLAFETTKALKKEQADIAESKFKLNPTAENYEAYSKYATPLKELEAFEKLDQQPQQQQYTSEKVMADTAKKGMAKVGQRTQFRKFREFLATGQLEGTKGLGKDALDVINKSYSRAEKTAIMNKYKYKMETK
jgi:hypothetical protein